MRTHHLQGAVFDLDCLITRTPAMPSSAGKHIAEATLSLLDELARHNIPVGVASSRNNCSIILEQAGLSDRFESVIDGKVSADLKDAGKPESDIFLLAAKQMGVPVARTMLVEDSTAGVQAGRKGRFGLVVGAAKDGETERLRAHGADIAVKELSELTLSDVEQWFTEGLEADSWKLRYHGYSSDEQRLREALTTVGNGYFGTRGSLVSEGIHGDTHNPGTYIHNLFNCAGTEVHGRTIKNNDFVNCPNWALTTVHVAGGERLSPETCEIEQYEHELDTRQAIVRQTAWFRDGDGNLTRVTSTRFASMVHPHIAALRVSVQPLNHREPITIRTSIDGAVCNYLVSRYRKLEQNHLEVTRTEAGNDLVRLQARTRDSDYVISMTGISRAYTSADGMALTRAASRKDDSVTEEFTCTPSPDEEIVLEKFVAIYTDKDLDAEDPESAAHRDLSQLTDFRTEQVYHADAWAELWKRADITVEGDRFARKILHLHAYHLLCTAGPHNSTFDAGLPARGLHGEAYRGHIFWDELFIMPFFTIRFPEIAKSHLMYRYRRLEAARELARENGYRGAMYPWQSADSGGPESQELHYNPRSGEWDPDLSNLQRHIGISIGYDVYTYFSTTGDTEFLRAYGMEMLLEIGRFWASIATYEQEDDRYHITGVMGPDEFHEKYPDASIEAGGLRDNTYTNVMAAWLLHKIAETYRHRPEEEKKKLEQQIDFHDSETHEWDGIVSRMKVAFVDDLLMSQFEGYMDLKELDWDHYQQKYGNIRRMDRILKAEDDSPDRYKVAKQADVLMLFYLLGPEQVSHILELMGYPGKNGRALLKRNYEYYVKRTSHGSTLSWIVHSAILSYLDEHKREQWEFFVKCLESDVYDTQGGTTLEGIHCGVMAGSIDIIVSGFCGISLFRDHLSLEPRLPDNWTGMAFTVENQGALLRVEVELEGDESVAYVTRLNREGPQMGAVCGGTRFELPLGTRVRLLCSKPTHNPYR